MTIEEVLKIALFGKKLTQEINGDGKPVYMKKIGSGPVKKVVQTALFLAVFTDNNLPRFEQKVGQESNSEGWVCNTRVGVRTHS